MLKKLLKTTISVVAAAAIVVSSLTGCNNKTDATDATAIPADPHEALSLAKDNTFTKCSGYDVFNTIQGTEEFRNKISSSAFNEKINLKLIEMSGIDSRYDNIFTTLQPEISLDYSVDPEKPSFLLGIGLIAESLNVNLLGKAYMDADKVIFGVSDVSKMYELDLPALASQSSEIASTYEDFKESLASIPQSTSTSVALLDDLKKHFDDDYEAAWQLCNVTKTSDTETLTLSDGSSAVCEKYEVEVTPDAVLKLQETFTNFFKTNENLKKIMTSNPSSKDSYDELINSLDSSYEENKNDLANAKPFKVDVLICDNIIRKIYFEQSSEEYDESGSMTLTMLGKDYPLDDTQFVFVLKDTELFNVKFTASEDETTKWILNLTADSYGEKINFDFSIDYNESTTDCIYNMSLNSDDVSFDADMTGKYTVDQAGSSYNYSFDDLTVNVNASDKNLSFKLSGNVGISLIDSVKAPASDKKISSETELNSAMEELRNDVMSKLDIGSIMGAIS